MPLFIKMMSQDQDGTGDLRADDKTKNFWWTFEFSSPRDEERLFTLAAVTNSIGSELIENSDNITLKANYTSSKELDDLLSEIREKLELEGFSGIEITRCYRTNNQNWSTQHLDAFPPLNVGRSLVVMAPWHRSRLPLASPNRRFDNSLSNRVNEVDGGVKPKGSRTPLYIYPATAFGTGYHESTQIALELLENSVKRGDTIIDVGTGTGILFIAALKLGAVHATARDIDPITLDEVRRNMNLNGLSLDLCDLEVGNLLDGIVSPVRGDVNKVDREVNDKFNILTANILLAPNMAMLPDVKRVLKFKGCAIFSGMTNMERGAFLSVLETSGLEVEKELKCGDWWGCRAKLKK